nr:hypothetical protein [Tanacetum cinerariifolium]
MNCYVYSFCHRWLIGRDSFEAPATILHSAGVMALLQSVTIPPSTGNLSIPWVVDDTAWIFLRLGRPMIPLYGDGDLVENVEGRVDTFLIKI